MITLTDGTQIEYHASFSFPRHVFLKMKQEDKDMLRRERAAYHENRRNRAEIQELRSHIQGQSGASDISSANPPADMSVSNRTQVSQISTGTSIMGGRNEQANSRQQARQVGVVITQRHLKSASPAVKV